MAKGIAPGKWLLDSMSDTIGLFYPDLCVSCGILLVRGEENFCLICRNSLPETHFHIDPHNPVFRHFWGRVNLQHAASLYYFAKGSRVQHMMHELKYNGKKEIGEALGKMYGTQLLDSFYYQHIDLVVPVPLHPEKQFKRGYNQSEMFARGLATSMNIPCKPNALKRLDNTASQTRKGRYERWENVEEVFACHEPQKIVGKHILLVDDVVTTGATLESCAQALLLAGENTSVSAVTIACAEHL